MLSKYCRKITDNDDDYLIDEQFSCIKYNKVKFHVENQARSFNRPSYMKIVARNRCVSCSHFLSDLETFKKTRISLFLINIILSIITLKYLSSLILINSSTK